MICLQKNPISTNQVVGNNLFIEQWIGGFYFLLSYQFFLVNSPWVNSRSIFKISQVSVKNYWFKCINTELINMSEVVKKYSILLAGAIEHHTCTSVDGQDTSNKCPGSDTKLHLMVRLQSCSFGELEYFFNAITPRSTLTWSGSTS